VIDVLSAKDRPRNVDGVRGGTGPRGPLSRLFDAARNLTRNVVCGVSQPFQELAYQNRGAVGIGAGGSLGIGGWFFGTGGEASAQVVASPQGEIGIAISLGWIPGVGVAGAGANAGVQFSNSDAQTLDAVRGGYVSSSVSVGPVGVGGSSDLSGNTSTITGTVGVGAGAKVSGSTTVGRTWIPVSVSCR
jgi:hypothetical protein